MPDLPTIGAQDAPTGSIDTSRYILSFDNDGNVQKHALSELVTTITNGVVTVKNTIADVKDIPTEDAIPAIILAGGDATFDGFGGILKWDSTGTDADDPPRVIRPNDFSSAGVYRQIL